MARPAPSVTRVVSLISLLGEHRDEFLTLSEIARHLSLNKATAHGILTALTDTAFVIRHPDDKGYTLGPSIVRVGRAALAREYEIAAVARHEMEMLATESDAQCGVYAVRGDQIMVIALTGTPAGTPDAYLGQRGRRLPPMGMVMMAWASDDKIEDWLIAEELDDAERGRYRESLSAIRERGFSVAVHAEERPRIEATVDRLVRDVVSQEVNETLVRLMTQLARESTELIEIQPARRYHLHQIAAPVFDESGAVRLALFLTGLPEISGERVRDYGYALSAAASRISRRTRGLRSGAAHEPMNSPTVA
jgi:DNA-binding IclR family transcriptional regulator